WQYPRVALRVDDVPSLAAQLSGLRDRKYDLTFARMERPFSDEENDVNVEILFNDHLLVAASVNSRWAHRRKIDIAELIGEPWVLSPPDTVNYVGLEQAFRERGLGMPKASLVSLSAPLRAHMLSTGQYLTVFTSSALQFNADRYGLKALPVDLPNRPSP